MLKVLKFRRETTNVLGSQSDLKIKYEYYNITFINVRVHVYCTVYNAQHAQHAHVLRVSCYYSSDDWYMVWDP